MAEPLYQSDEASVTNVNVCLRGQDFPVADITSVSYYDESVKAKRWVKFGLVVGAAVFVISLIGGRPGVGFVPTIAIIFGGGLLLLQAVRPAQGIGVVIEKDDGSSEIVNGLSRSEVPRIVEAIEVAIGRREASGD